MSRFQSLSDKLSGREPATIVFINDTGFIGGAGVAHRRQIQSFLAAGHTVAAVCWLQNLNLDPTEPRGSEFVGNWLGMRCCPELHQSRGCSDEEIARRILRIVTTFAPDLVVVGNLHWAGWKIDVVEAIASAGIPTICYLHDAHWLTGRCAYTGGCTKYLRGCDETCPTPTEYPAAAPAKIFENWTARRRVFCGARAVPLFANSRWMRDLAKSAFHGNASVSLAPLGLDHALFSPIDQKLARRMLGISHTGLVVLAGAVNLKEERKSGAAFAKVLDHLSAEEATIVTFGAGSAEFAGVTSLGLIADERIMPLVYSASDVLIHAAVEESFGQTLMEAASCGLPVVAFESGGMPDIARNEINALTMTANDHPGFLSSIHRLLNDGCLRKELGTSGRRVVAEEYTLLAQYQSWVSNVHELANVSV